MPHKISRKQTTDEELFIIYLQAYPIEYNLVETTFTEITSSKFNFAASGCMALSNTIMLPR